MDKSTRPTNLVALVGARRSATNALRRCARTGAIAGRISMQSTRLVMPPTLRVREKFRDPEDGAGGQAVTPGYSVRGARGFTQWAIDQLLEVMLDLTEAERRKLAGTSPHAFRHTVGTQMLAAGVALEVVQRTIPRKAFTGQLTPGRR
ncbi:hypothetical protein LL999_12300 [Burkholderia ambifaria]|uniref:hypothetical protein n=1 Tax=Burkholderia ambifaria TaxID=152480 RepID=UPI001E6166F3|nr:hypothetical protein [Burkholderia ambifaria]UEP20711.1 hypothetical protein LL999_12300 [Burkholderia ambifaria]